MEYIELCNQIKSLESNRELAKSRGENSKAKKYSYRIDDAIARKKAIEAAMPNEVLKTLEDKVAKLEADNISYAEKEKLMRDKILTLEARIENIINPPKPEVIIESAELTVCPNCGRAVSEMTEHQKKCIKS